MGCSNEHDQDRDRDAAVLVDAAVDSPDGGRSGSSAGCGTSPTFAISSCGAPNGSGSSDCTIAVDGAMRVFHISVPSGYDVNTPLPLVFGWHQLGSNGATFGSAIGHSVEQLVRGIFVYADGLPNASLGGAPGWHLEDGGVDFRLLDTIYGEVTNAYCINLGTVWSFGHSSGGFMSNAVGCHRSNIVSAAVEFSGGPEYHPTDPPLGACLGGLPVLLSHGETDPTVPFAYGTALRDLWKTINGCSDSSTPSGIVCGDGSGVAAGCSCVAFDGCADRTVWCDYPNLGHDMPPNRTAMIATFFLSQ